MTKITTPITAPGSVTAPNTVGITLPAVESARFADFLPLSTVSWDETFHAVFMFNGYDEVRHIVNGDVLTTGILPPRPDQDMTVTPKGARATATLDLDDDDSGTDCTLANNDQFVLGPDNGGKSTIQFVTTFSAVQTMHEVLLGADNGEALDNLIALIQQSGSEGVEYQTHLPSGDRWTSSIEISASDTASANGKYVTFRSKSYGTSGNGLYAFLNSGFSSQDPSLGSSGTSVGTSGNFEGGTNGSGSAPGAGDYEYAYRYYRKADGAISDISDRASGSQGVAQNIDLSGMIASSDPNVEHTEWLRTKASALSLLPGYRFQDSATIDTDDLSDTALEELGGEAYDLSIYRPYRSGMIPRFRYGTVWKGHLWGGGTIRAAKKTYATISFTKDSTAFTYSTGLADAAQVGRTISVGGGNFDGQSYIIVEVDEAAGTGRMNQTWPHTTGGYACDIIDARNPFALYYSEPLLPNNFPPDNEITGIQGRDDEGITGVVAHGDRLVVFTKDTMWVVTGDSLSSFKVSKVSDNIGCVCGHTIVSAEGTLVWLALDGVYAWAGGGQPVKYSSPSTEGERARGIDATVDRINWEHIIWSHARYDSVERTIEIYVPLDDDMVPNHAMTIDLDTRGTWSLDDVSGLTMSRQITDLAGNRVAFSGDEFGNIYQMNVDVTDPTTQYHIATSKDQAEAAVPTKGHISGDFSTTDGHTLFRAQHRGILHKMSLKAVCVGDGGYGFEPVQTAASGTVRSATVSGTPFPTSGDGLNGIPCLVVRAAGTVERTKIVSNTSSVLTFDRDLASAVTSSDQVVVGGFLMDIETGRADVGETRRRKILAHVVVNHSPGKQAFTSFTWAMRVSDQGDF